MMDNFKTDKATNLKEYSLFFSFPTSVKNVEAKKSYTLISYVSEFSGWLGLLLGIGAPNLLRIFDNFSDKKIRYKKPSSFF